MRTAGMNAGSQLVNIHPSEASPYRSESLVLVKPGLAVHQTTTLTSVQLPPVATLLMTSNS